MSDLPKVTQPASRGSRSLAHALDLGPGAPAAAGFALEA